MKHEQFLKRLKNEHVKEKVTLLLCTFELFYVCTCTQSEEWFWSFHLPHTPSMQPKQTFSVKSEKVLIVTS